MTRWSIPALLAVAAWCAIEAADMEVRMAAYQRGDRLDLGMDAPAFDTRERCILGLGLGSLVGAGIFMSPGRGGGRWRSRPG